MEIKIIQTGLGVLCLVVLSTVLFQFLLRGSSYDPVLDGVATPEPLRDHTKEFNKPEIIKVTDGVYVAIGYALANSIMLEGPEGLVIVDTTENEDAAKEILQEFRNISSKPIKAIVYTHNHADHCRGVRSFIEDAENPPVLIAHELFENEFLVQFTTGTRIWRASVLQFGAELPKDALENAGIGPFLGLIMGDTVFSLMPTLKIKGQGENLNIAGLDINFIHIPGETPDQLGLWLPDKKVLLCADDIYKTFPNLYAIRGTPPRDVQVWADSLYKMATLKAEYLVPSHTRPVKGEKAITDLLVTYANAIMFIHDQTVRYINKHIHPEEITKLVKLPPRLANHRYLLEFYGTVEWTVKTVYTQYLGWFSHDPVDLNPLTPSEKAKRMVKLLGISGLLKEARSALSEGDLQWALELSTYVYRTNPHHAEAALIRRKALKGLGGQQTSANARHFYLMTALDEAGGIQWFMNITNMVMTAPISRLLSALRSRIKAEEVDGVTLLVGLNFTDTNELFTLHLQDSVLRVTEVKQLPRECDVILTTTTLTWKSILLKKASALSVYLSGDLLVEGSLWQLKTFMGYFDTVDV